MGEYIFQPIITKQYIESIASQEQLMYLYTGLIPKANKLYSSPFRKEIRPSCSFYTNKHDDLVLKDFGTGSSFSWINIVMYKYSCNYGRALQIAAEDLGIISKTNKIRNKSAKLISIPKIEKSSSDIKVQIKEFTKKELEWWNSFGISQKTLKYYNTFSIQTSFLNGKIHMFSQEDNPIYGYYFGKDEDLELWKLYFPKTKNKGYRFLTNAKENIIQGWKQLPKTGEFVVITKALKDVMLLYEFGIPACAPNSETVFLSDNYLNNLKSRFKNIIVLFDSDFAGISSMRNLRKKYPELSYTFIPRKYAKDLSDFYKRFGLKRTIKLIEEYKLYFYLK